MSAMMGPGDAETFEMELSGFLREYGMYVELTSDGFSRFDTY
jgi:hypothetical protein